jgi:large conductance mechanosensitive channel
MAAQPKAGGGSVKKFVQEFRAFISTGNMVDLAVGIILGLAVKAVIDAVMSGIVNPIIGAIVGKPNLDNFLTFTVRKGSKNEATISIGVVLTQIISLILVGLVLFLFVRAYNRFRRPEAEAPAGPSEIDLLTEIRDELRARG